MGEYDRKIGYANKQTAALEYRCGAVWVKPEHIDSFIFDIFLRRPSPLPCLPGAIPFHEGVCDKRPGSREATGNSKGAEAPLVMPPCIFQNDLYTNDWCAVELVGEGLRGGKVVRLFHGKRPGGRQAIVHKSTARVVSGTAAQPVRPLGLEARV